MIEFEFSVSLIDNSVHEFDLGDISISHEGTLITSFDGTQGTMMIFVSLSELLFGIEKLTSSNKKSRYEFVGADSSFRLLFENNGDGKVLISKSAGNKIEVDAKELKNSLASSAKKFFGSYSDHIEGSGAVKEDFERAISAFS